MCVVCKDAFVSPWDLMVHAQAAHMINIYEIGDKSGESAKPVSTVVEQNGAETATTNSTTDEVSKRIHGSSAFNLNIFVCESAAMQNYLFQFSMFVIYGNYWPLAVAVGGRPLRCRCKWNKL